MDILRQCLSIAVDRSYSEKFSTLLFVVDAMLSRLIVLKVPYTEIDWKAYMQQVAQYAGGERNYFKIHGDTGPLVYPAAHLYIYWILSLFTDGGLDIRLGQYIFMGVYLATLFLVIQCYRSAGVPPYVFPLLVLSKRMHSIFLLRLFNDGFAVFFLFLAIFCYQRRLWTVGSFAYSIGLGVKMSLLLPLPAIGVVLLQANGRNRALRQALMIGQIQVLLAYPFIGVNPLAYLTRAFDFTRQFLFKWTVNWRFIGEETFLSKEFSGALLAIHASLLALFAQTRWLHESINDVFDELIEPPSAARQARISRGVTPEFILTSILSAMTIGCLCARSLHYQFYAYIAWSTPFLLWKSGLHPVLIYAVWAAQEWAWNVYPSTNVSSLVVVGCLSVTLASVWLGTVDNRLPEDIPQKKEPDYRL